MNTFGKLFRLTTFGESHGHAIGGVIDGCPAGIVLNFDAIRHALAQRRPGQSSYSSPRNESDEPEWLSGIDGDHRTTGAPIAFIIRNRDVRSEDYDVLNSTFRPGHADLCYFLKYGVKPQPGGGRASARETAVRVVAGAIARQMLPKSIQVLSYTSQIGHITSTILPTETEAILRSPVRCPDIKASEAMCTEIEKVKKEGDSIGGIVSCSVKGLPAGLGEPVYDKLSARLAEAMMSIPAAKGFEIGDGFDICRQKGSQTNGYIEKGYINHAPFMGGVLGGISTGEDLRFRVAFKPTSTISMPQASVNLNGNPVTLEAIGRHDPCVVPRAVSVVEAMTWLVTADLMLMAKTTAPIG